MVRRADKWRRDSGYGGKAYDSGHGDVGYGDNSYGDSSGDGNSSYGDSGYVDSSGHGDSSYGDNSYGDSSGYGNSNYGDSGYVDSSGDGKNGYGKSGYGRSGSGDKAYSSHADEAYDSRGGKAYSSHADEAYDSRGGKAYSNHSSKAYGNYSGKAYRDRGSKAYSDRGGKAYSDRGGKAYRGKGSSGNGYGKGLGSMFYGVQGSPPGLADLGEAVKSWLDGLFREVRRARPDEVGVVHDEVSVVQDKVSLAPDDCISAARAKLDSHAIAEDTVQAVRRFLEEGDGSGHLDAVQTLDALRMLMDQPTRDALDAASHALEGHDSKTVSILRRALVYARQVTDAKSALAYATAAFEHASAQPAGDVQLNGPRVGRVRVLKPRLKLRRWRRQAA